VPDTAHRRAAGIPNSAQRRADVVEPSAECHRESRGRFLLPLL
jgi:hypothetical protein